ncbi:MAG: DUF4340 domain-containing protein [Gammaproteobacteria bacterium]
MTSRARLNLALLITLGGLALIIYLLPEKNSQIALTTLDPEKIADMGVQRAGQTPIRLRLGRDGWRVTRPFDAPANIARIGTLLKLAGKTSHQRYAVDDLDLSQYGIDPDSTRILLNGETIVIGNVNPVTRQRYAQAGGLLHVITDDIIDLGAADAGSFVTLKLLPEDAKIETLSLPALQLERQDDSNWKVSSAESEPEGDSVENLVSAWQNARAVWAEQMEAGSAAQEIAITLAGGEELRFEIVTEQPELVLRQVDLNVAYHLVAEDAVVLLGHGLSRVADDHGQ